MSTMLYQKEAVEVLERGQNLTRIKNGRGDEYCVPTGLLKVIVWKTSGFTKNLKRIVQYLKDAGLKGLIADEGIERMEREDADGKPKVNCVAPIFTSLKKVGAIQAIGRRLTRHGSTATVYTLVPNYEQILRNLEEYEQSHDSDSDLLCAGEGEIRRS